MNAMVKRRVHVAAAAIISADGEQVLIARRPSNVDHGGLWEFPGGKLAPYETGLGGLKRELLEELGVEIQRARSEERRVGKGCSGGGGEGGLGKARE